MNSVFDKHQKKIAIQTLKMNDAMAGVMGGMTKEQARSFLKGIGYSDAKIRSLEASDKGLKTQSNELLRMAKSLVADDKETSYVEHGVEVQLSETNGKYYAKFNNAKTGKLLKYYSFRSEKGRDEYVKGFMDQIQSRIKAKQDRKVQRAEARKNFVNPFKVGDILYSSWGYDQTNIDFYRVVKVLDKMVEIVEISSKSVDASHVVPGGSVKDGKRIKKIVQPGGYIRLTSFSSAYKWDGKPKYETPAGMGH